MAKTKKESAVPITEELLGDIPPGEGTPVLPLPPLVSYGESSPSETLRGPSCRSCRYWNRQLSSDWGECRRRLLNVLVPNRLTKFGPEGTFLVTPSGLWCGDYSQELNV